MADKVVQIPKIGNVAFPSTMKDEDIAKAAGELHDKALTNGVSKFMENDPAIQGLRTSEKLKALANIAQMLEKHPLLAQAVDKGMGQVILTASSQPSTPDAQADTAESQTSQAPTDAA